MNIFDSLAPDIGTSLAGGTTGGLAGFIQGMQLKQKMEEQALQNKRLALGQLLNLGHGGYGQQDPDTGAVTFHQAPGTYPGGLDNLFIQEVLKGKLSLQDLMGVRFKTTPEILDKKAGLLANQADAAGELADKRGAETLEVAPNAQSGRAVNTARIGELGGRTKADEALTRSRDAQAATNTALASRYRQMATELEQTAPDRARILTKRADLLEKKIAQAEKGGGGGNPMNTLRAENIQRIFEDNPNALDDPVQREELMYWMNQPEYSPGMSVQPVSKLTGKAKEKPAGEPGIFERMFSGNKEQAPAVDPGRVKKATDFILSAGYGAALKASKTKKMPNGGALNPDDAIALEQALADYTKK